MIVSSSISITVRGLVNRPRLSPLLLAATWAAAGPTDDGAVSSGTASAPSLSSRYLRRPLPDAAPADSGRAAEQSTPWNHSPGREGQCLGRGRAADQSSLCPSTVVPDG